MPCSSSGQDISFSARGGGFNSHTRCALSLKEQGNKQAGEDKRLSHLAFNQSVAGSTPAVRMYTYPDVTAYYGGVAQLVERMREVHEATGSTPVSTTYGGLAERFMAPV